jgi:hypothetical protein
MKRTLLVDLDDTLVIDEPTAGASRDAAVYYAFPYRV